MQFLHTMIRVSNIEHSLNFFCNLLGLQEKRRSDNQQGRFTLIFLGLPNEQAEIELTYNWDDNEQYTVGRNFGHLAFRVDDIYKTCQKLMSNGVIIHRPPRDGYMAFVKSPDNISIELLQKGNSLQPAEPWASMKNQGTW